MEITNDGPVYRITLKPGENILVKCSSTGLQARLVKMSYGPEAAEEPEATVTTEIIAIDTR